MQFFIKNKTRLVFQHFQTLTFATIDVDVDVSMDLTPKDFVLVISKAFEPFLSALLSLL